jgi:hypothetical protein
MLAQAPYWRNLFSGYDDFPRAQRIAEGETTARNHPPSRLLNRPILKHAISQRDAGTR